MNCDCRKTLAAELVNNQTFKGKPITKAEIDMSLISIEKESGGKILAGCTYTEAEIIVEGYKRPQKFSILHSFCPFCGVAISPYKDPNTEPKTVLRLTTYL